MYARLALILDVKRRATYIILMDSKEKPQNESDQVRQARNRMSLNILVDYITINQKSDEFIRLVVAIHNHVLALSERSEEETQPIDMTIKDLITRSIFKTFSILNDYFVLEPCIPDTSENYKALVDECYKLREFDGMKVYLSVKDDYFRYRAEDYEINLVVGLIAVNYAEIANAFLCHLYTDENFRLTGAKKFFETTFCYGKLSQAAFIKPHSEILVDYVAFTELVSEGYNLKEKIENLIGNGSRTGVETIICYPMPLLYKLVYPLYDRKGETDVALKQAAANSQDLLGLKRLRVNLGESEINMVSYHPNMTKLYKMTLFKETITPLNIFSWIAFIERTNKKIENVKIYFRKYFLNLQRVQAMDWE